MERDLNKTHAQVWVERKIEHRANMKLEDDDDRMIIIAAFRYSLGRRTYVPSIVAGKIKDWWPDISTDDRTLIKREIREAIESDLAGDWCDVQTWKGLLKLDD